MTQFVYHLVEPDTWAAATTSGQYAPPSLAAEGFIHLSFAQQLAASANRHYSAADRLLAIAFDPATFAEFLVVEDTSGHGEFPHVYRPVDPDEATDVIELRRIDDNWVGLGATPQT